MYSVINQKKIYFQKVGKGKNLILLHGWKQDTSTFWPLVGHLKEDFTLWLIDLPGFGQSPIPEKPYSIEDYARVIAQFIKKNNVKNPILLGHSFGGAVAIKLSSQYSKLITKLILEDASGIRVETKLNKLKKYMLQILAKIIKFTVPNIFNLKKKLRLMFYRTIESDYMSVGELKESYIKIVGEDLRDDARKIKTETLIIWGEKDSAIPLMKAKKLNHLIKNSRLEVFDEAGHFPHLEKPELFAHYVKDFC